MALQLPLLDCAHIQIWELSLWVLFLNCVNLQIYFNISHVYEVINLWAEEQALLWNKMAHGSIIISQIC